MVFSPWLKDEAPVDTSDHRVSVSDGILAINDAEKSDEGRYECQVFTGFDQTSSSGILTVLNEAPSFASIPNNIRVLEGRDKKLICQANGIPTPKISWKFNDRLLESDQGHLSLVDVGRNQEGQYVCLAENRYGIIEREVHLQVIRGVRKENENLVPDVVKNIKETISLPCDFKIDKRVEEETQFIWLKNSEQLTIDETKYSLLPNKSLLLQNISLKDNGYYTCNVVNPLQSVNSTIQLIVSGESPEIINNFDKITIHEGETLELDCRARGSPQPSLEWLVRDRPVLSRYLVDVTSVDSEFIEKRSVDSEFIEKRVKIRGVSKNHEGLYQCVASNNVGSVMKNSHVIVIRRTKVTIASDDGPQEIAIQAGQKLKLPCNVDQDENNKITNIVWTKDDLSLQVGVEDRIDFGYDGSLTIFNVQKRHEGRYKCKVKTLRDEASAEVPLKVIVNAPVITKYSQSQKVFSGTSLNLECKATGIPFPETTWTFNKTATSIIGENYFIKKAITADSGYYTCTSKNSIGETKQTIRVSVVTVPRLDEEYKIKTGSELSLPCVRSEDGVSAFWQKDNEEVVTGSDIQIDNDGSLIILNMTEKYEGGYSCRIRLDESGEERTIQTRVLIMPDIVLTKSKKLVVDETGNFTLKCDVLPGVNAKIMWKKDGELVVPSSEEGVDIIDFSSTLIVNHAKVTDTGTWSCVATTSWGGRDTIEYNVLVKQSKLSCNELAPPSIKTITGVSNSSVRVEWDVLQFNESCVESFKIFWWTNHTNSSYYQQSVSLNHRVVTIGSLVPDTAYYFQVNLVRDSRHNVYQSGLTRSHWMTHIYPQDLTSSTNPKAVIIVVIIVIVLLTAFLIILYYKREEVTDYIMERKKAKSGLEFAEYPTKLTANPDFMASLAPQWPEPEPDPTEDQAFLQQQKQLSKKHGSRTSITSSWSSLFNVVSTEDISNDHQYRDSMYKGRSRKE